MRESGPEDADALVRAATGGDAAARSTIAERLGVLVERYLESSAGAGVRRFASVSDLRQEVLLDLDDLLARLRPGAGWQDVEALAIQRARWRVQKAARSRRAFAGESMAGGAGRLDAPDSLASEGAVTRADRIAALRERLDVLEPEQREVVERRLSDITFQEIGARLGLPESTARYRFLTALGTLRASMERG